MESSFVMHSIYTTYPPTYNDGVINIPLIDKHKNFKGYVWASTNDASYLLQYSYSVKKTAEGKCYAKSSITTTMHELVMRQKAPDGHVIDHRNGNKLDNRRENLKFSTYAQNAQNKEKMEGCTSEYIGVHLDPNGQWRAFISNDGEMEYLGAFADERFAAKMYDIHRINTLGPDCKTNNTLKPYEIEWIVKNGIPPGYEKAEKNRDLPTNIKLTASGSFQYNKMRKGVNYNKTFKTLDEAIEYKEMMEKQWSIKESDAEKIRASEITRNSQGIAVVYATSKDIKYEIMVDDHMWPELSKMNWHLNDQKYAITAKVDGVYSMHRYIWLKCKGEIPEGKSIDHIKSNMKLDNRMSNLRPADPSLQIHNQLKKRSSLDKYRGIQFRWPKYVAIIGHTRYGKYDRAEDAAQRANEEYAKIYGENATLNVIDWSIVTTKETRITREMITRTFIQSLTNIKDFENLLKVMKLDTGNNGPIQLKTLRGKDIPNLKIYLLDNFALPE